MLFLSRWIERAAMALLIAGCAERALPLSEAAASSLDFAQAAGADLAGVVGPGMTCVPTGAEDCYNGVDDDCNGLVDCADPGCSANIAECVPSATDFELGIALPVATPCPAGYSDSSTTLGQGLSVPGGCSGCDCNVNRSTTCSTTLKVYPASACPGTPLANSYAVDSASCVVVNVDTSNAGTTAIVATGSCGVPSGTPLPAPLSWASQTKFCQTLHVGGGCSPGNVCVPKKASGQRCILGSSVAACIGNYAAQQGGTWFSGSADNRDCGDLCFCNKQSDGTCSNSKVTIYQSSTVCSGPSATLTPQVDACGLPAPYFRATVVPGTSTLPTCNVGNTATGNARAIGQSTLCCLP